jgi:hypothetical protein
MKFEWQNIRLTENDYGLGSNARAKVFGGWIVKDVIRMDKDIISMMNMVFIPDPHHEWEIDKD